MKRALLLTFAIVLAGTTLTPARFGGQPAAAQPTNGVSRPWGCLAGGQTLGTPAVDPCPAATLRPTSIHLSSATPQRSFAYPDTPRALTAVAVGHTVTFSWIGSTTGDPADAYVFEAGSARGRSDLANADIGSAATTLTTTGVPSGTYFVRMRTRAAAGTSPPSNEVTVTVQGADCATAPNPPNTLFASANGTSVSLIWGAPVGGCPATSYTIDAGSASGLSNLASFATGTTATTFSATGVAPGTYFVRVRATNSAGTSAASAEAQFTIGSGSCPSGPPAAPSGLQSSVSGNTVVLSWTAPASTPTSYVLEAGSTPGASNLVVTDTGNAATSLTATASPGLYYVRVRARSACGTSAASTEIAVIVSGTTSTTENVFIIAADLGGNRLTFMTDMNGADWQTGPTGSTVPSIPNGGSTLNAPWHIAVDSRQRIYIADRDNNRVVRMDDLAGHGFKTFSGVGANPLAAPGCDAGHVPPEGCVNSVAVDPAGRIYIVADGRIVRIDDMDGTGWTTLGGRGTDPNGPGALAGVKVIIIDAQGRMLVSDSAGGRIVRFNDMQGSGRIDFGSVGSGVGQFQRPEGLALDSSGRIYIADHTNHRIVRINDMTGAGWISFGSFGDVDPAHPIGTAAAKFDEPHDIAIGPSGKIYVLDTVNGRIVRIDDMSGAGWTTFGTRTIQQVGCTGPQDPLCRPPGLFEFVAPKGLRVLAR